MAFISPDGNPKQLRYVSYVIQRDIDTGEQVIHTSFHKTALGAKRAFMKRPHPYPLVPGIRVIQHGWSELSDFDIKCGFIV